MMAEFYDENSYCITAVVRWMWAADYAPAKIS